MKTFAVCSLRVLSCHVAQPRPFVMTDWRHRAGLRVLATLLCLAIPLAAKTPATANWAQTYFNGAHTGYNPAETKLGRSNISSLQLLWAAGVPGGVTNFVINNGVVYATGQANNLVALNATTGTQIWSTNTGGIVGTNSIAVGGGLVFSECFFTDTGANTYGAVCAYRISNGKRVWQFSAPCNCLPEAGLESSLVLENGVLYFGYSAGGGDEYHAVYAVNATSGQELWSYGQVNNSLGVGAPAVGNGYVYLDIGETNFISALTASNGNLAWSSTAIDASAAVSVSGGVVYASTNWDGTDGTVYAFNGATGAALWSYSYTGQYTCGGAEAASPPAIAKGVVYFQGADGELYALKAKDGSLLWAAPVTNCYAHVYTSPSVANGVVYIGGGDNGTGNVQQVTAYNAGTGAVLWSSPSPHGTLWPSPEVVNGVLYFASPGDSICSSICAYTVP